MDIQAKRATSTTRNNTREAPHSCALRRMGHSMLRAGALAADGEDCQQWPKIRGRSADGAKQAFFVPAPCSKAEGRTGQGRALRRSAWRAAARHVPCDARSTGPRRNSLRSLRSLCSDSRRESVHEARCARGRPPCASREPPDSRPSLPGPPLVLAGDTAACCGPNATEVVARLRVGPAGGEYRDAREAQRLRPRAAGAPRALTHRDCLSETNAVSEASFAVGRRREHRRGRAAQQRATARF